MLAVLLVFQTREGRVAVQAVSLVPYVFADAPARPLDWVTGTPPHDEVRYDGPAGPLVADLYRPADGSRHAAMLLSLGVHPVARDDPSLVRLCTGLARDGFVVLVPESADLRADRIVPSEIDEFVAAVHYLRALPSVDAARIGLVGFSAGASLLTVAAADARVRDDVHMVNFFGGYYDAVEMLREVASRRIRLDDGTYVAWRPDPLARQIFGLVLLQNVDDAADREAVAGAIREGTALTPEERSALGERARLVYDLFTTDDPTHVDALIETLPADLLARLAAVSPSAVVGDLRARIYVMHDTDDHFVPFVESRRLVAALPAERRVYTEFSIFAHVEPTRSLDPLAFGGELAKLVRHLYLALYELS